MPDYIPIEDARNQPELARKIILRECARVKAALERAEAFAKALKDPDTDPPLSDRGFGT
jgi:hypothetical protein